jgi:L-glutamine-phosphate cytidylyltransferase|tara:strand:+ start:425 stop:1174 length:750 start_codon:yes stop_codon:yes gene_type:complete
MKAIIIAAGSAKRLGDQTRELPKGLLDINGKSILERQIDLLKNNGINKIIMITGPHKEKFKFKDIQYIEDLEYEQHDVLLSLMAAKNEIKGDVITIYSDILFDEKILQQIVKSDVDIGVVTDMNWQQKYENRTEHPKSQADNVIIENNKVIQIKKNISTISERQKNGEFIGIMKFSEKGSEKFVTEYNKIEKNRLSPFHDSLIFERAYLTDMIQELIDQKINVDPIIVDGNWCEIDTPQDLENAKKIFC